MTMLEPRTWKHTILQGSDEETLRELRAAAERIKPKGKRGDVSGDLLGEDPWGDYDSTCQRADDFATEAEGRGVTITLRAVGRKKWRELVTANPPRDGNDEDQAAGFNVEEFPEALVPACLFSLGAGEPSEGAITDLLDALTPAQFDLLAVAAFNLHSTLGANPKDRLLSAPAAS